ncbi:nitroreductase family protein, partial [Fusobacterium sp.]
MDFLSRRSIRKYKDIPVEKEKLDEILKTAIVAPT